MNKCEWKDGEFKSCCKIRGSKLENRIVITKNKILFDGVEIDFCPWCSENIRKPEPEVIIKQSGGTWVARYYGVDYLCLKPNSFNEHPHDCCSFAKQRIDGIWKPTKDLQITDEIAKLRPMVVCMCGCNVIFKLYGVGSEHDFYKYIGFDSSRNQFTGWESTRLATVKDLS